MDRNQINRRLLLEAKATATAGRSVREATAATAAAAAAVVPPPAHPVLDVAKSTLDYGHREWVFRCPTCPGGRLLEHDESGYICWSCWTIHHYCEKCDTSTEEKFDAEWMHLVSWTVPLLPEDQEDGDDDDGEDEKDERVTSYTLPWRPLDNKTGKVYEGRVTPLSAGEDRHSRFYGCDSSSFTWRCPLCSATCLTNPD